MVTALVLVSGVVTDRIGGASMDLSSLYRTSILTAFQVLFFTEM
jgi:hypothetical protein